MLSSSEVSFLEEFTWTMEFNVSSVALLVGASTLEDFIFTHSNRGVLLI